MNKEELDIPAPVDVLIVGAGPTGLALAALLQALGATVRVIDRQPDRVHESRALAIQPRTLEILTGLGISRTLLEHGNQAVQMRLHFGKRVVAARLFDLGVEDTAYPFLLFLSQAETERVLDRHLADRGVMVERRVELTAFTADEEQVTCTLRHHDGDRIEQVRAGYLVGCDGGHSTVRQLAGIGFAGGAYPQTFALGDLEAARDMAAARHATKARPQRRQRPPMGANRGLPGGPAGGRRRLHRRYGAAARPGMDDQLPSPSPPGHPVPRRPDLPGRRRGPRAQPRRGARHEHRHPGRLEPRLEAGAGHPRRRRPISPRYLPHRALADRPGRAAAQR